MVQNRCRSITLEREEGEKMYQHLQKFKQKLQNGEKVYGAFVSIHDSSISELMGWAGFDYIWLDAEHFPLEPYAVKLHAIAASSAGIPLFVRIRCNDPMLVKPLIDAGVDGVIFPMIQTVEEARKAIASCVYPPTGIRGFGPSRCIKYDQSTTPEYISSCSDRVFKIIQVEDYRLAEHIDEVAALDGVDALMFGPQDLSSSMGKLTHYYDDDVQAVVKRVAEAARKHGVVLGTAAGDNPDNMKIWAAHGVNMFCTGTDIYYLRRAAVASLKALKEQL